MGFLQKNAFSCRRMRFRGVHRRKLRFRAQESRALACFHKIFDSPQRPRKIPSTVTTRKFITHDPISPYAERTIDLAQAWQDPRTHCATHQNSTCQEITILGQDQKGYPQKGYPRIGQISPILGHFIQQFLREISRNRPDHGYPFCRYPFGPCRNTTVCGSSWAGQF